MHCKINNFKKNPDQGHEQWCCIEHFKQNKHKGKRLHTYDSEVTILNDKWIERLRSLKEEEC